MNAKQAYCRRILCVLGFAFASTVANAVVIGPDKDFAGFSFVSVSTAISTGPTCAPNPFPPPSFYCFSDLSVWTTTVLKRIYVATYIDTEVPADPSSVRLVDIWAVDDTLPGGALSLIGFNPASPEMVPLSEEHFTSFSGTTVSADLVLTQVGALTALLPGFDLSAFGGDPSAAVYVAQAIATRNDFLTNEIPEPTALALLTIGIAVLYSRRRRQQSFP
jgi:hypothetical protein